jgi:Flp pilus assembly protein TadD
MARGLTRKAIFTFHAALALEMDLPQARFGLGVAYEALGWADAAAREYETTIRLDPDHADAHNNLGIILAKTYRLDEAIDHFRAAVRARPADPETRLNLARAYEAKGLAKEAEDQRRLAAPAGANVAGASGSRPASSH